MFRITITLFLISFSTLFGLFPVAHQGRFHPDDVYIKQSFYELYHAQKTRSEQSAAQIYWNLHFNGLESLQFPIFYVHSARLKEELGLPVKQSRFTYQQINRAFFEDPKSGRRITSLLIAKHSNEAPNTNELTTLASGLRVKSENEKLIIQSVPEQPPWNFLSPGDSISKSPHLKAAAEAESLLTKVVRLKRQSKPDEPFLSVQERLSRAGEDFKALPYKAKPGEWISLRALSLDIPNFTPYSDDLYSELVNAYQLKDIKLLSTLLEKGYEQIAGLPYIYAKGKNLSYPSFYQLKVESLLYSYPWLVICAILYGLSFFAGILFRKPIYLFMAIVAFALHTLILAARCFVLERPPVSNMFETVIYVPWVAMLGGFILHLFSKEKWLILSASLVNVLLLLLLEVTQLNNRLDNVQAVLDSQYWLLIHVLMVVGSYGMFALAGVLGHLYLGYRMALGKETDKTQTLGRQILQSMYLGTALLIPGTLLGGVWAAESWGRFWDWDPKESWAFISSCVYLIWIHAYRFGHIRFDGLAIGSVIGLMAISFTWYGVNYILGTGLHSYGFGSGGETYYYLYLAAEGAFLTIFWQATKTIDKPFA